MKKRITDKLWVNGLWPRLLFSSTCFRTINAGDTTGSFVNVLGGDPWYNASIHGNNEYFSDFDYYSSKITAGVDFRANNIESFENVEKNSTDFYASVRSLYLQDRAKNKINKC